LQIENNLKRDKTLEKIRRMNQFILKKFRDHEASEWLFSIQDVLIPLETGMAYFYENQSN